MTKETFIERMIELYKKGEDTRHLRMCAGFECNECPAHKEDDNCYSDELLIDEIIRLKRETNLEHYFKDKQNEEYHGWLDEHRLVLEADRGIAQIYNSPRSLNEIVDWLLLPYEPPKRYQMSQLCYDIIKRYVDVFGEDKREYRLIDVYPYSVLLTLNILNEGMNGVTLGSLLENAEVVE